MTIKDEIFKGFSDGKSDVLLDFIVDNFDEIPAVDGIEGKILHQGSTVYVVNEKSKYVLNNSGAWVECGASESAEKSRKIMYFQTVDELPQDDVIDLIGVKTGDIFVTFEPATFRILNTEKRLVSISKHTFEMIKSSDDTMFFEFGSDLPTPEQCRSVGITKGQKAYVFQCEGYDGDSNGFYILDTQYRWIPYN